MNIKQELLPSEIIDFALNNNSSSKWVQQETSFGVEFIDFVALKSFYNRAINFGMLKPMDLYDPTELLTSLQLIKHNKLTNAGYFLFTNNQPLQIKMHVYMTDERINSCDNTVLQDNIYNIMDAAISYIKQHIDWRVEFDGPTRNRVEIPEIPILAIKGVLINLLSQVNYNKTTEIQIAITPTRIEIYNPNNLQYCYKTILNILSKSQNIKIQDIKINKLCDTCRNVDVDTNYKITNEEFLFTFSRKQK